MNFTNIVNREQLIPSQLLQLDALIKNQDKFLQYSLFPQNMEIRRENDNQIFSFQIDKEQHQQQMEFFSHHINSDIISYLSLASHIVKLMAELSKYNIHLPTFDIRKSILFTEDSYSISKLVYLSELNVLQSKQLQNRLIIIYEYGLQWLSPQNINLPWKTMAFELVDMIREQGKENIVIDEKMTVFSLGCALYYLQQKSQIFAQAVDNNDRIDQLGSIEFNLHPLNFYKALYADLTLRCIDYVPEKRPSLQKVVEELERVKYFNDCTCSALRLINEKLNPFAIFIENNSLHFLLNQYVQYEKNDQATGRIWIIQNLAKIKFVVHLSQSFELKQKYIFYLLTANLICTEIEGLDALIKYANDKRIRQKQIPLYFNDSLDEIQEFTIKYSEKYRTFLLRLYSYLLSLKQFNDMGEELNEKLDNRDDKNFIIQTPQLLTITKALIPQIGKLFDQRTANLLIYCLNNLGSIFLNDYLPINFRPFISQLVSVDVYDQQDDLITMLLDKNMKELHDQIYQNLNARKIQ